MAARCPACGAAAAPGALLCGRCGVRLSLDAARPAKASRVAFPRTTYIGGHPRRSAHHKSAGLLVFDEQGIQLTGFADVFFIPWADIRDVTVEEPQVTARRLVSTSVVPLEMFAIASSKHTEATFVSVVTDTYSAVFEVDRVAAGEVQAKIAPWTDDLPSG